MFNNNFLNFCKLIMLGHTTSPKTSPVEIRLINNTIKYLATNATSGVGTFIFKTSATYEQIYTSTAPYVSGQTTGWAIGSDNTPATANDYNLYSYIPASSKYSYSISSIMLNETGKYIKRIILTYTNISNDVLTIGEVGYYDTLGLGDTSDSTANIATHGVLLYREAFETPIVLQPTESVSIIVDLYAEV